MPRIGVGVVHDVTEDSWGLHDQLLRSLPLDAAVAHPAGFFVLDQLDNLVVAAENLPIVLAEPILFPDRCFGDQLLAETGEICDELASPIAGKVDLRSVQANDVAHLLTSDWLFNRAIIAQAKPSAMVPAGKRFELGIGADGMRRRAKCRLPSVRKARLQSDGAS